MSQELQIEIVFKPEADRIKPSPDEVALIYAVLPDLIKLVLEMEAEEDKAA